MEEKKHRLIPFEPVNLRQVAKIVDTGLAKLRRHYDTAPTGEDFANFVDAIHKCLPKDKVPYDTVLASLLPHVGTEMSRADIKQILWRLAGNLPLLRRGEPVPPWTRQFKLEWCPVTITKADRGKGYDDKPGYFYRYKVMAGTPAGLSFTTFWSAKYARFVGRDIGFKRSRRIRFTMADGRDLVNMQLYLLFDPELSKDERPVAYHFHVPATFLKENQQIIKQRFRQIPCPLELTLVELKCVDCHVGYDQCPAACHAKTFVEKVCPRCKAPDAYHDPESKGAVCVDCEEHERKK